MALALLEFKIPYPILFIENKIGKLQMFLTLNDF